MDHPSNHTGANLGKVWIVIPVRNRRAVTERCLARLAETGVMQWARVLVVDDGSSDGTRGMVESGFPEVSVVAGDGQLWWSGAIRLGMETAIAYGAGCIIWLNDDTLPERGALDCLAQLAQERAAVCGGIAHAPSGVLAYAGGTMQKRWPQALLTRPLDEMPLAVEWLHGNMVAIPAAVWRRIGLNECRWMKHNFADIEYTLRAHRAGVPVLLVPAAQAEAALNDSASYWSWRDPRLSWGDVLAGFASPKVWWYLPGLVYFKAVTAGATGVCDCFWVCVKAMLTGLYKGIAIRRLTQNIKRSNGIL